MRFLLYLYSCDLILMACILVAHYKESNSNAVLIHHGLDLRWLDEFIRTAVPLFYAQHEIHVASDSCYRPLPIPPSRLFMTSSLVSGVIGGEQRGEGGGNFYKSTSLPQVSSHIGKVVEYMTSRIYKSLKCNICSGVAITNGKCLSEEGIIYMASSQRDHPAYEKTLLERVLNKYLCIKSSFTSSIQCNGEGGEIAIYKTLCICIARKDPAGFLVFTVFPVASTNLRKYMVPTNKSDSISGIFGGCI